MAKQRAAGERDKYITLQLSTKTRDAYGREQETWVDVAQIWAQIQPLRGREFFDAQKTNVELTHRITISYRANVTPNMRAKFGRRLYYFQAPLNIDAANREIQIMSREALT